VIGGHAVALEADDLLEEVAVAAAATATTTTTTNCFPRHQHTTEQSRE
jgi:hypothetical protein